MKEINLERLKDLVLARLSVGGNAKRIRPSDVSKGLYPLVERRLTKAEWERLFDRALTSLRAAKLVDAQRLVMTAAGAARLGSALGLKAPPAAKDWRAFKSKYLPRLASGGAAESGKMAKPTVTLLAQRLGIDARPDSTLVKVVDAWLCATLGLPSSAKVDLNMLRGALLARELGLSPRTLSAVARVAAATLSGATSSKDSAVSDALTSRWLFDDPAPALEKQLPAPRPAPSRPDAPPAAAVELIAAKVLQAADGPDARQFGPNKVFIGSVWRALAADPEIRGLGEAAFKRQLAEAHRRGLLQLARADLVAAMDPSEVSASEIVHQNATYHFILRGASA